MALWQGVEEVFEMTAHRPKKTGPLEESALIEVLFSRVPNPGSGWMVSRHARLWHPSTDLYETEDQFVVLVEVAGVSQDDISVILHDRRLAIVGMRGDANAGPGERRAYHQMEVSFGEFRADVDLPGPVDEGGITAEYSQGFLRVTLPKLKPQSIEIK
jgi:HSP20 family protein